MEENNQEHQVETPSSDVITEPTENIESSGDVITGEPAGDSSDREHNRWVETQRKLENRLSEKMEEKLSVVLDKIQQVQPQQQQQQYSVEELEDFAEKTDNDTHRAWAKREIRKLEQQSFEKTIEKKFSEVTQKQRDEQIKAETFRDVVTRSPELVIKDQAGNFVGWNESSPLYQQMNRYLGDPALRNRPDALSIARKLALGDMYEMSKPRTQKEIVEQKEKIKDLQKKTMIEAGGSQDSYVPSPEESAMANLMKSGSLKDAAKVFGLRRKKNG